jgi:predicted  nucleic acid-binding Zn-ribbon protein
MLKRFNVQLVLLTGFALLGALSASSQPASSETGETDPQTLRAILVELRALHNDVRLTAISQIQLTELQTQQAVVNAATERVSNARLQLSNLQSDEKRAAADVSRAEDLVSGATDASVKAAISQEIDHLRAGLAGLKSKEEGLDTSLQEAEGQLRAAQDTLDGIQKDLDATVKKLRPVAGTP